MGHHSSHFIATDKDKTSSFAGAIEIDGDFSFGDAVTDSFSCNGLFKMGTNASPLVLTAGSPLFTLYTTCSSTTTTNAESFIVKNVMTGVNGYGGRSLFHAYTNVSLGSNFNALKMYAEFGASGRCKGHAAAANIEMKLANASIVSDGGAYTVLKVEYVAGGTSLVTAGSLNGNYASFMYFGNNGDADGDFDDNGFFLVAKGLTAGAGHVLSANSQTLRIGIGTSTKYLMVSGVENTLTLGSDGGAVSYVAGTPLISVHATNNGTSGSTSAEPFLVHSTLTGAGQVGGRSRFYTTSNVASGGWVNALKAHMNFGSSGRATGLASALCAEMDVPNATLASGNYYPLEIELNPGASTVTTGSGTQMGFIYMAVNTNTADFLDNGYIMKIAGLGSAASSHVFQTNSDQPTHALRIMIDETPYYLLMTDTANATE